MSAPGFGAGAQAGACARALCCAALAGQGQRGIAGGASSGCATRARREPSGGPRAP